MRGARRGGTRGPRVRCPAGVPLRRFVPIVVLAVAAFALWIGWREFWFLCDDAFIEFRYVSSAHRGWGYVWNPPPWRPVEGYTSFLWVALLDLAWRVTGAEPPVAAPLLSLGFSYVSLGLVAWMAWRLPVRDERMRVCVLAAVLASTLSNRTFLAWTSSGLETALVSALVLAWVAVAVFRRGRPLVLLSAIAAVLSLARPDGLLYAAATAVIVFLRMRTEPRAWVAGVPLVTPLVHVAWRLSFYGYPLPNTYYAKHVGAWPLAGGAYLASFLLEYAFWVWVGVVIAAGVAFTRRLRAGLRPDLAVTVGVATVVAHFAYYTFDVGGDHFEYRVYHAFVPLVALSFFAMCHHLGWAARRTWTAFVFMTALGLVLPWTHWWHTRTAVGHKEPGSFKYPIAEHVPLVVRPYAMAWDGLQRWLLNHFVGIRHQGHRTYLWYQQSRYPERDEGERIPLDGYPVLAASAVGYPAWTMPNVAIVDRLGLNDLVVARTPALHTGQTDRKMAHDRAAPKGYVACFRPNVDIDDGGHPTVRERQKPLTAEEIRRCEDTWLAKVQAGEAAPARK